MNEEMNNDSSDTGMNDEIDMNEEMDMNDEMH